MEIRYIIGPPGTGKTTTIGREAMQAAERTGADKVSICSLTKTAAREAAGRVELPEGHVGTLHSLAFRALGQALGGKMQMAETHTKDWTAAYPHWPMAAGRTVDDSPSERNAGLLGEELLASLAYLRACRAPVAHAAPAIRHFAQAWTAWKTRNEYLDFTDLLEHSLRDTVMAPQAPAVLFVDEAQDLSQLEVDLLFHWGRHLRELVLVGDPYQNLYAWRGSNAEVVFPASMAAAATTVLAQSYRIPGMVHARALRWVRRHTAYRDFAYAPRSVPGKVTQVPYTLAQPEHWLEQLDEVLRQFPTTMIVSSCGYLLRPLVTALRRHGIPFHNPWRLKNGAWNPLATSSMPARIPALLRRDTEGYWQPADVALWGDVLQGADVFRHGQKTTLASSTATTSPWQVEAWCRALFTDEAFHCLWYAPPTDLVRWWRSHLLPKYQDAAAYALAVYARHGLAGLTAPPRLIVGTIHSLKGSEADCVLLAPDLSKAGHGEWSWGGAGRDAIIRQVYVGITRAKEQLLLMAPSQRLFVEVA